MFCLCLASVHGQEADVCVWGVPGPEPHETDLFVFGKRQAQGVTGQICLCLEEPGPGSHEADFFVFGKCQAQRPVSMLLNSSLLPPAQEGN